MKNFSKPNLTGLTEANNDLALACEALIEEIRQVKLIISSRHDELVGFLGSQDYVKAEAGQQ